MTDKTTSKSANAKWEKYSYQRHSEYPKKHQPAGYMGSITNALIVDDCASTRLLLSHYVQLRNFKTWSAPSGEAALELSAHYSFDLIFMDISLPGIDGIEAIRRMRKMETFSTQTEFIICSGYTPPNLGPDLGSEQVPCDFLHKPICRQKFNHLMDRLENKSPLKPPVQALDKFDDTILNSIFDEADDRLKYRICMELHNDISRHVNNMLTADKQHDLTKFERATHALKGISGTFGAISLHGLAHQGNQMARNAKPDDAFGLANKIEASALLALDKIQHHFQAQKSSASTTSGA